MKRQVLVRGNDGRYRAQDAGTAAVATWLPNVTVPVCATCNNGWMGQLEENAKQILGPFVLNRSPVLRLSEADVLTLATWVTKSWMAYALLLPSQHNPFSTAEYRAMATSPWPLARSRIWMMHSHDPEAHVSMALRPTLVTQVPPANLEMQNNTAFGLLGVASVVFFVYLVREDADPRVLSPLGDPDVDELGTAPPMLRTPGVRRIWDRPRPQYFPLEVVPAGYVDHLWGFADTLWDRIGLPSEGLNDGDVAKVAEEWLAGERPRDIRDRWGEHNDRR